MLQQRVIRQEVQEVQVERQQRVEVMVVEEQVEVERVPQRMAHQRMGLSGWKVEDAVGFSAGKIRAVG